MTRGETKEALAILLAMLGDISAGARTTLTTPGRSGADLRRAVGDLQLNAELLIKTGGLGAALLNCFTLARSAGANYDSFETVRANLTKQAPVGVPAILLTQAGIRMALTQMSRVIAATVFVSRADVEAMLDRISAAFADAEEYAADNPDTGQNYQALVTLRASVTRDLVERARPLPRMVTFTFANRMPAHWLAQRLYADGSRAQEIIDENKPVHPAFMPTTIKGLSQ